MSRDLWNRQQRYYDPGATPMPPRPITKARSATRKPRSIIPTPDEFARINAAEEKRARKAAARRAVAQ